MNRYFGYLNTGKAALMVCLFLFYVSPFCYTQDFRFDETTKKAYDLILNFELEEGRAILDNPRTPQEFYVLGLSEAIELMISEDQKLLPRYEAAFDKRISGKNRKNAADEMLLQTELHLHWAFIYLKFGQELDAAFRLRQAYLLSKDIQKKFPDYQAILKTAGLLNVLIGSVPEKYNWVLGLLNMKGSVNDGLNQMKTLAKAKHDFTFETVLWYSFIHGYVLQQPETAIAEMNRLVEEHPHNRLAAFLLANFHLKNASSEKALHYLQQTESGDSGMPVWYTYYLKGEVYLHKADYGSAVNAYSAFLQHYRGQNFIKDAQYKIGLCFWLNGKQDQAIIAFREAEQIGKEATEADKHAARSLASSEMPSVPLTKIRYFTDGGYYQEAEELLDELDAESFTAKKHQVEYFYRKARLAHKLNKTTDANTFYLKTIELSNTNEWYYAPNSCLQLGYLAESAGNYRDAKYFFEKALSYKRHEYKNSIDSKARSALAQLKDLK